MTDIEALLDPLEASDAQLDGRIQADRAVEFLRAEYPKAFANARMRGCGFPGRWRTRWIKAPADHRRGADGHRFDDAVARMAWPIESHDRVTGYAWETFDAHHGHYVPLRSMTPRTSTISSPPAAASTAIPPRCPAFG